MSSFQGFILVLAFLQLAFQLILKKKNETRIKLLKKVPPEEAQSIMDEDSWKKTSDYSLEKSRFSNFEEIFGFITFIPIFLLIFPWVFGTWNTSTEVGVWRSAFVVCCFFISLQALSFPLDWYKQFVLEEKYGFNKSSLKLWISDKLKGLVLGFGIGILLLSFLLYLFREISSFLPEMWWVLSFCIFFIIQLILMVLWPKIFLTIS